MDTTEAPAKCCLDCRFRRLMAGWYGTTRYLCVLDNRPIDSAEVLSQSCGLFAPRRGAAAPG